jgi:hypothetical protein
MTNRYYRSFEIIDGTHYGPPAWLKSKFDGILSKEITIQQGDRLDIIAQQVYGDSSLWKAIAVYNGIGWFFVEPGEKIYLPVKIKDVTDRM